MEGSLSSAREKPDDRYVMVRALSNELQPPLLKINLGFIGDAQDAIVEPLPGSS